MIAHFLFKLDHDELPWTLHEDHDSNAKLSNEKIVVAIAINNANASCLERANTSRVLHDTIQKHIASGNHGFADKDISR